MNGAAPTAAHETRRVILWVMKAIRDSKPVPALVLLLTALTAFQAGRAQTKETPKSTSSVQRGQASASIPSRLSQEAAEDIFEQSIKTDIRKDYKTELQLCKQLADNKDVRGEVCLWGLYGDGKPGISKDLKESEKWQTVAADHGDAFMQTTMANKAKFGSDLQLTKSRNEHPLHPSEAAYWDRKVAEQGDANDQFDLAILLFDHDGVAKDDIDSYKWATLAMENTVWPSSTQGFVDAAGNMRSQLARRMTRDQISAALKHAHDWQPKITEATRVMQQADRTQERLRGGNYVGAYLNSLGGPK